MGDDLSSNFETFCLLFGIRTSTLYNVTMILSMTGFGAYRQPLIIQENTVALVYIELRSINSRFLDLVFRTPDEARGAESVIREQIAKRISRGKVECRIHIQRGAEVQVSAHNHDTASPREDIAQHFHLQAIAQLQHFQGFIRQDFPLAAPLSIKDILTWPGVIRQEEIGSEELQEAISKGLEICLEALIGSRRTEGEALAQVILQCINNMQAIVLQIENKLPEIIKSYQDKLSDKLLSVLDGVDQQGRLISKDELVERIKQEVVMYGVKIDIAEEINRLKTHFEAVRAALLKGGPVGKRLDFLMQELQRESNTLGAKSVSQETSDASMELKLLVEQIREQVQNLE
jgi:uncharacterized protein (TIGR00255 family)